MYLSDLGESEGSAILIGRMPIIFSRSAAAVVIWRLVNGPPWVSR